MTLSKIGLTKTLISNDDCLKKMPCMCRVMAHIEEQQQLNEEASCYCACKLQFITAPPHATNIEHKLGN